MRKVISVLLVALMIFSVAAISVSAAGCGCTNHIDSIDCRCCINCPTLPKEIIMSCAKDGNGNYKGSTCCAACAGYLQKNAGCGCDCKCCGSNGETSDAPNFGGLVTEKDKQNFVDSFQAVLGKISAAFDKFFDAIFEFLRLDEILGRN